MLVAVSIGQLRAQAPSRPPVDAPELAALGDLAVGTRIEQIAVRGDRRLAVRLWYPAVTGGIATPYRFDWPRIGRPSLAIETAAIAVADAVAVPRRRFPLIILSHGYRGFATSMSYLGENLASTGYVVAAIDHDDAPFSDAAGFARSFGAVVVNRSHDQRVVIATLLAASRGVTSPIGRTIDPAAGVGLVGYSMGGFGALASAGAAYDPAGPTLRQLPAPAAGATTDPSPRVADDIKALVLIAPWGGQPASRAWTPAALSRLTAPTLIIAGNQDDVVDYTHGVRWLFESLTGADRRLLVYREARHNVGGNAPGSIGEFAIAEATAEPIWRSERLNAINVHFITAMLDLHLKRQSARSAYLDLPSVVAADGVWPSPPPIADGRVAGDAQPGFWRGFQRRWAVGLEMHRSRSSVSPDRGRVPTLP